MEKRLGLPYSPLCDRNTTLVAESQIGLFTKQLKHFYQFWLNQIDFNLKLFETKKGFIDFIVSPSMDVCGDLLDKIYQNLQAVTLELDSKDSNSSKESNKSLEASRPKSGSAATKPPPSPTAGNPTIVANTSQTSSQQQAQQASTRYVFLRMPNVLFCFLLWIWCTFWLKSVLKFWYKERKKERTKKRKIKIEISKKQEMQTACIWMENLKIKLDTFQINNSSALYLYLFYFVSFHFLLLLRFLRAKLLDKKKKKKNEADIQFWCNYFVTFGRFQWILM